jgi:predicted nucleic-acid-binding protein
MSKTIILDTNAILRYILKDNLLQFNIVKELIENDSVFVPTEIIAEVVYVVYKVYKIPHNLISNHILFFLEDIDYKAGILVNAIKTFGKGKLDFVDCLLVEYSKSNKYSVFSFDKKLKNMLQN